MKLEFCLIPRSTAGMNARTMLPRKQWDIVRFKCYQDAGYTCEVCDGVGSQHPVECHEQWEWDVPNRVQRLTRLIALCPRCHQTVHIGYSMIKAGHMFNSVLAIGEEYVNSLLHMAKVNHWTFDEVCENLKWHRKGYLLYNDELWTVNIDLAKNIVVQSSDIILEEFEL